MSPARRGLLLDAPTDPVPIDPVPTDPVPIDPVPIDPVPTDPAERISPLPDGSYDAFVISADDLPTAGGTTTAIELTITSGEHRSETLALTAPVRLGEPVDLMGMPATLTITDGAPSVRIDS